MCKDSPCPKYLMSVYYSQYSGRPYSVCFVCGGGTNSNILLYTPQLRRRHHAGSLSSAVVSSRQTRSLTHLGVQSSTELFSIRGERFHTVRTGKRTQQWCCSSTKLVVSFCQHSLVSQNPRCLQIKLKGRCEFLSQEKQSTPRSCQCHQTRKQDLQDPPSNLLRQSVGAGETDRQLKVPAALAEALGSASSTHTIPHTISNSSSLSALWHAHGTNTYTWAKLHIDIEINNSV